MYQLGITLLETIQQLTFDVVPVLASTLIKFLTSEIEGTCLSREGVCQVSHYHLQRTAREFYATLDNTNPNVPDFPAMPDLN